MRLRQLVLACGLASLALSSQVNALGLGEVKLKSALNQPLQAEVKLLDTRDLTAEQILVTLASPADFERNGVDRLYFYTEFQFTVDLDAPDGPKVLITSRNPVREPYLNFLIEARWTAGRLLREYTLLMDLPTFEEDAVSRPVQSATSSQTRPARQTAPARSTGSDAADRRQPARTATPSAARPQLSGKEYEVRSNDTLWEIASRGRPDSSVSVHQSMMALYRANPDAFIDGNINRLRRGQVLRIPDAAEMKSLSKAEAVSQFAAASSGDSTLGAQINASRRTPSTRTGTTEVSGRVKLAAPTSDTGSGQGSGANDGAGKALESELAATLEELDKSKAENTELSSRVRDLEAQVETMQRLVDVSNEKLRSLQIAAEQKTAESAQAQPAVDPIRQDASSEARSSVAVIVPPPPEPSVLPADPADPADPTIALNAPDTDLAPSSAASLNPVSSSPSEASSAESSSVASSAAVVVPPPPPSNKVVSRPTPKPTLIDSAIENAPWIGIGILVIAGVAYLVYRRRKQQEEEEQALHQDNVFATDESTAENNDLADTSDNPPVISDTSSSDEEDAPSAVAETGDVVGEAEIYIAYGKLDQAEDILLNALKKDPDSTEIRMKLLEVYAQQQNVTGFDRHYAALLPIAGAALLARAADLRAGIPGAEAFNGESAPIAQFPNEADATEFDLDDGLSIPDEQQPTPTNYQAADFDFELELDEDELPSDAVEVANEPVDEFSLELADETDIQHANDLSELSLALDSLDSEQLPDDLEVTPIVTDDDFTFELDERAEPDDSLADLALEDGLQLDDGLILDDGPVYETPAFATTEFKSADDRQGDPLEVPADDFNLDKNFEDIDLAALDHDMESLDEDLDDEELAEDTASISDFAAQEVAKDEAEPGLDLDDEMHLEDLSSSSVESDDDFDSPGNGISFNLEDEKALDAELDTDFAGLDTEFDDAGSGGVSYGSLNESPTIEDDEEHSKNTATVGSVETDLHDEDLFSQALSDFSIDSEDLNLNEFASDEATLTDLSDDDSDLDFLADADEAATKLDLARAYIDMGDTEGARDILSEVISEGNENQRDEATKLLDRIV